MAMLGNLGENLTNTMKKLVGMSVIDKKTIKEVVKDIQRALIQSDVNIKLVLDLSKKIESRALEEEPPKGITPREHVITIIYDKVKTPNRMLTFAQRKICIKVETSETIWS